MAPNSVFNGNKLVTSFFIQVAVLDFTEKIVIFNLSLTATQAREFGGWEGQVVVIRLPLCTKSFLEKMSALHLKCTKTSFCCLLIWRSAAFPSPESSKTPVKFC